MNSCQRSIVNYKNLNGITGSGTWRLDTLTDSATGITYKIYSFTGGANGVSLTTNSKWYYLCIGGGGNGGNSFGRGGGGGGAGGYLDGSFNNINEKISINTNVNLSTKISSISGDIVITSYAGGNGGVTTGYGPIVITNGANGGSGGGATQASQALLNSYGQGTSGQGYMGYQSNNVRGGGGGGKAGGIYKVRNGVVTTTLEYIPPTANTWGMDGVKCILPGISLLYTNYYCAGGGGGANITGSPGTGTGGSGGAGGLGAYDNHGGNATTYGSGGGGAGGINPGATARIGGSGYQGIIVIAFAI
jgi:hypothetical protein